MSTKIAPPNASNPIVEDNGTMVQQFRSIINELVRAIPLNGMGSPEDVVEAFQGQTYHDLSAAAGLIVYVKTVDDVGGDKKKGWLLG